MAYAHSENTAGRRHKLVEHLTSVTELARGIVTLAAATIGEAAHA